ncbi:hypothetical protein [Clostridium sp. BJN0013]|uniref:hypothetical protein n=1 Tax=Clostridium sp. BJN0013 TaxID=3236840 RepID=UPI0034C6B694
MSKILCLKHSDELKVKLKTILRNSRIIDFIDVKENIQSSIIYGQGKVTRTKQILKSISGF